MESIQDAINDVVNPILASHGGQASLIGVNGNKVTLSLTGNCAGCPGKTTGTKRLIQNIFDDLELNYTVVIGE